MNKLEYAKATVKAILNDWNEGILIDVLANDLLESREYHEKNHNTDSVAAINDALTALENFRRLLNAI